jgi:hypothetical protein
MTKAWFGVVISIMLALLPVSSGLTAQAANSDIFSSHSSSNFPILIAQSYGDPRSPAEAVAILARFEPIADQDYDSGMIAWNNRQYNQAFNLFAKAADNYWLCKGVRYINRQDETRVTEKYNEAIKMRDQAHQLRG